MFLFFFFIALYGCTFHFFYLNRFAANHVISRNKGDTPTLILSPCFVLDLKSKQHRSQQVLKRPCPKYYTLTSGSTLGHDVGIERELQNRIPGLQKAQKLENCDFILVFCPVVSRAGSDIEVAVKMLSTQPGKTLIIHKKRKKQGSGNERINE